MLYTALQTFSSTGRRHSLSSRFSIPPKRIVDIEGHHCRIQDRLNPPAKHYRRRTFWRFIYEWVRSPHATLINAPLIQASNYKPSTAEWMDLLSIVNTYGYTIAPLPRLKTLMSPMITLNECSWPRSSTSRSGLPLPTSRCTPVQTLSKHLKPRS